SSKSAANRKLRTLEQSGRTTFGFTLPDRSRAAASRVLSGVCVSTNYNPGGGVGLTARASSLRIALLTYRGAPYCGGQGVYVRHLSRALKELGHHVEVFAGPPYPELETSITLHPLPSLALYRPEAPFRPN